MQGLPAKPIIETWKTPYDIIGKMLPVFKEHFKAAQRARSAEEYEQLMKPFTADTRSKITAIYNDLHEHGFYPSGFDKNGNIKWNVMTEKVIY